MPYIEVALGLNNSSFKDILIAELMNSEFESIEEKDDHILYCYIPKDKFNESILKNLSEKYAKQFVFKYEIAELKNKNWNEIWEKDFKPVVVDDFCLIRAPFHEPGKNIQNEIIIEPKMAFGTGHHETTYMMIQQMAKLDFNNKTVLDFGCGTGVLAILASKLSASKIYAIDNDEWAYNNCTENVTVNHINNIDVIHIGEEFLIKKSFDIILANITRNIILETLDSMVNSLNQKGMIILSGILNTDKEIILKQAEESSLKKLLILDKNDWSSICLIK